MPQPKLKLLIFTPTLQCGGSEKYVSILCNNINIQKFDVTLCVVNNACPFYKINNTSVEVIDLKKKHVRTSLLAMLKIIKLKQPHIIFTTANHLNIYLAVFRRLFPKNIITIARESSVVSVNTKRSRLPGLYNRLIKKYYKRFDAVICQSKFMQQDLIDNYNVLKNKTFVINNPVEEIVAAVHAPVVNKFVTVARLSEEKGIDRLIRIVAKLSIPFQYYIIGGGNKKEELQQLIATLHLQSKVFLVGERNDPFAGMEDASLFLMGSHYEGFPNTLLEAGMLGIPVVAFDVPGGINEIIINGENGLHVKDNDEVAFGQAIEKAMHTNFNGQQIKQTIQTKFSVKYIINKTEDLFMQLFFQSN